MKVFFKDSEGNLRTLKSEQTLDINNQKYMVNKIQEETSIKVCSPVLALYHVVKQDQPAPTSA